MTIYSYFLATIAVLTLLPATVSADFPDMKDRFFLYQEAVSELEDAKIVQGNPDGNFDPERLVNRAEFTLMLLRQDPNLRSNRNRTCFSDVPENEWYTSAVCYGASKNIIRGYPDGTFQPEKPVNAIEALALLVRVYKLPIKQGTGEDWFEPIIDFVHEKDILSKYSYTPDQPLTREIAADFLYRLRKYSLLKQPSRYSPPCSVQSQPIPTTTVQANGVQRTFAIRVPNNYSPHSPAPLLFGLHGRTNSNEQVRAYFKLDRNFPNAIIVYPAAIKLANGTFTWIGEGGNQPDTAMFDAVYRHVYNNYCIDTFKVYTAGHSLGGWYSNGLACKRGSVIRASASVGGSYVSNNCSGPAAAMIIHNPNDRLVAFSGAESMRDARIEINNCSYNSAGAPPVAFNCVLHSQCSSNPVFFCPHGMDYDSRGKYYPHNWPKDTGKYMYEFFQSLVK